MRNNTYTQIHIQLFFAVQNRQSMILESWREQCQKSLSIATAKYMASVWE
jgi:hypothetical protein